ncbi:Putative methyltransferase, partial [Candidatus Kryptonium thompsonii]
MNEFIVDWRSLNYPIDLESIFNRNSETELEIGFGNGIFLLQIARDNPG